MAKFQDCWVLGELVQQRQRVRVTRREKAARRVAGKGGVGEGGKEREKEKERKLVVLQ